MSEEWKLDKEQRVVYVHHRYVYFQQKKHDSSYMIFLNFCQVDILNDIIRLITLKGATNLHIPLGGGVLFTWKDNKACLHYMGRCSRCYILFHRLAWDYYIRHAHKHLITLVRNDRRYKDCECALANVRNTSFGHTKPLPYTAKRRQERKRRRVLFRQTAHDAMENKERDDASVFHKRNHSSDSKQQCYGHFARKCR